MKISLGIMALGVGILLTGCGRPSEKTVAADFLRDHPKATVLSAKPGEGDSDNVYFHIRYRLPDSAADRSEAWLYQRDLRTDKWQVRTKALPDVRY